MLLYICFWKLLVFKQERYSSFSRDLGQKVDEGSATLEEMEVCLLNHWEFIKYSKLISRHKAAWLHEIKEQQWSRIPLWFSRPSSKRTVNRERRRGSKKSMNPSLTVIFDGSFVCQHVLSTCSGSFLEFTSERQQQLINPTGMHKNGRIQCLTDEHVCVLPLTPRITYVLGIILKKTCLIKQIYCHNEFVCV